MPKTRRKEPHTKRSELLSRALRFINAGKYHDLGEYLFFGDWAKYEYGVGLDDDQTTQECRQLIQELADRLRVEEGRKASSERTSMGPMPPDRLTGIVAEILPKYSTQVHELLLRALERTSQVEGEGSGGVGQSQSSTGAGVAKVEDALDAFYARELLRRLPEIVSRAARLEKVAAESVMNQGLRASFREAHQCYLYGFRAATCVLCRGILEEALREALDPFGELEVAIKKEGKSYIGALLGAAVERGMLARDSRSWGEDVKKAGDRAIHSRAAFDREYPTEGVEEVLLKTRGIVNELYGRYRALPEARG